MEAKVVPYVPTPKEVALSAVVFWEQLKDLDLNTVNEDEKDFLLSQLKKLTGRLGNYIVANK